MQLSSYNNDTQFDYFNTAIEPTDEIILHQQLGRFRPSQLRYENKFITDFCPFLPKTRKLTSKGLGFFLNFFYKNFMYQFMFFTFVWLH